MTICVYLRTFMRSPTSMQNNRIQPFSHNTISFGVVVKPNGLVFYLFLFILSVLVPHKVSGQHIHLPILKLPNNLYFEANRLFNYNIYEGSRWGSGLLYTYDFANRHHTQIGIDGHLSYGVVDHRYKYGGCIYLKNNDKRRTSLSIKYENDIEQIASHNLNSYNIVNIEQNSHYLSSRYNAIQRIGIQLSLNPSPQHQLSWGYAYSHESPLFNTSGPLYPTSNTPPTYLAKHSEWSIHYRYSNRLQLRLVLGNLPYHDNFLYIRFIGQYERKWKFENNDMVHFFAQGGVAMGDVPISRLFDLSGTFGSHFYFTNTFLTVRPNSLIADVYTISGIRYTCGRSMYDIGMSKPQAFCQLNCMWGSIGDNHAAVVSENLHAPSYGIIEPAIGLHGIICFSSINIGAALAYKFDIEQLVHNISVPAAERFALMVSATVTP